MDVLMNLITVNHFKVTWHRCRRECHWVKCQGQPAIAIETYCVKSIALENEFQPKTYTDTPSRATNWVGFQGHGFIGQGHRNVVHTVDGSTSTSVKPTSRKVGAKLVEVSSFCVFECWVNGIPLFPPIKCSQCSQGRSQDFVLGEG